MKLSEQIKLNKRLYDECCKQSLDSKKIQELINQGANPLGQIDPLSSFLYSELVGECENLYEVTKIFLNNGMVFKDSMFIKDEDDIVNPLWNFLFFPYEEGIKTLQLLLDNNVEVDSVESFIEHVYWDYIVLDFQDEYEDYIYTMKMLMLCASYKYVFEKSEMLRDVIEVENNNYDVNKFRKYDDFQVNKTKGYFYFMEKDSNVIVWKIKRKGL